MSDRAHEESDEHGHRGGEMGLGGEVHMAPEEVVDGDVPLAREFEPRIPLLDSPSSGSWTMGFAHQSHEFHQSE